MAHTDSARLEGAERETFQGKRGGYEGRATGEPSGAWGNAEWITGADGKSRRVEPGVRLLAHGVSARVAKLRALGNAIVPQVAAEFVSAYMESTPPLQERTTAASHDELTETRRMSAPSNPQQESK